MTGRLRLVGLVLGGLVVAAPAQLAGAFGFAALLGIGSGIGVLSFNQSVALLPLAEGVGFVAALAAFVWVVRK